MGKLLICRIPSQGVPGDLLHYVVDTDNGKDFEYRGRVSANWFFDGPRSSTPDGKYCYHNSGPAKFANEVEKETIVWEGTIWDFYKHIGYDYKKKKYAKQN